MGGAWRTFSEMAKDARKVVNDGSPVMFQWSGRDPQRNADAAGERLVNVNSSWITPWPQADSAVALKLPRLYKRICLSMAALLTTHSHIALEAGVSWRWRYADSLCSRVAAGTLMCWMPDFSVGHVYWQMFAYILQHVSLVKVHWTMMAQCCASFGDRGDVPDSYSTRRSYSVLYRCESELPCILQRYWVSGHSIVMHTNLLNRI